MLLNKAIVAAFDKGGCSKGLANVSCLDAVLVRTPKILGVPIVVLLAGGRILGAANSSKFPKKTASE